MFNPNVSFPALLQTIFRELGIPLGSDEASGRVDRFHGYLIEEYRKDHTVVLFIDEAQNVPVETLENLRMLSNLESSEDKLLQIVLCGQTELESLLDRNELRQLKSRIAVRATISPLSRKESLAYIRHRLSMSSRKESDIFTKAALERIVRKAKGNPRSINILCDNALITGYGYDEKSVGFSDRRGDHRGHGGEVPLGKSGCGPSLRSVFSCSWPPDSGSMRGTPPPLRNPHATPSSFRSSPEDESIGFSRGSPGDPWEKSTKPWKRPNGRGGGRKSPPCSSSLPPGNGLRPVSRLPRKRRWSPFRGTSTPSWRRPPGKSIQFIGSQAGEGTSTVVRDFAMVSAARLGKSVLLLDADPQNPSQHNFFHLQPKFGWEEILRNRRTFRKAICRIGDTSLYVYPTPLGSASLPKALFSPEIKEFWEEAKEKFDLVLIDSAPASASPDGIALSRFVDGVVLVLSADKTRKPVAESLKNQILQNGGNLLGMVFNNRRYHIPDWMYKRL